MDRRMRTRWSSRSLALLATALLLAGLAAPVRADDLLPPWNGEPVSHGLGPTYGEEWCAPASAEPGIAGVQGPPLAIIPYGAIKCTLELFEQEAAAAGVPDRMEYFVIGRSAGGRDIYGVVVNALETPEQVRDYERWREIRSMMLTDPAGAQALLEGYGDEVKLPIFVEANIHGGEREGTDAMMQVIRDLVTTPYGENETVDEVLDHAIVVVIPTVNPDGRVAGTRANANGFDMNRDLLVQSQPEIQAEVAFQLQWLAPVGLALHGYYNPTLIDGLTKPHNPGIEYDKFLYWNQRRLDANQAALAAIGRPIQRPVNDWGANANTQPPVGPYYAEGWDDWGPFYTQTYMAFHGVDSSTVEMCRDDACGGRLGSKREQYLTFYSSAVFWIEHRGEILHDQLEIFRRADAGEARPRCCDDQLLQDRGFTEDQHNWMVEYPKAFVIPFDGGAGGRTSAVDAQRSDAEANRLVEWLLWNGIEVHRLNKAYTWGGRTFPAKSYVVWMNQPRRGVALTALNVGQDITLRIGRLYASPAAWSHGYLWGADVVEIPRDDATFRPFTVPVTAPNELQGGVRGGGRSSWYSLRLRGVSEVRAVYELLRSGVQAEIAETPFTSTTGGWMPAGTIIFPDDPATVAMLDAVGKSAGVWFERNWRVEKPPTTQLDEPPRVAILGTAATMPAVDYTWVLKRIFGPEVGWVSTAELANAPEDPLLGYDVLYNAGVGWPTSQIAQERLTAFFERGGGYIATSQGAAGFGFLASAGLVQGSFTQSTSGIAYGGIAVWENVGKDGPVTGGYSEYDYLFLPSSTTYFSAVPEGAVIDGRYLATMSETPSDGYLAGLWRNRGAETNQAPVIVHGETSVDSRWAAMATNPFSRGDAEREWLWVGQAALWSNLTDEAA